MARKPHKYHYIYKITCLKNNRYYIGMHSTSNLEDGYMGGGKIIKNSIKKHGKDAHRKDIIEFHTAREALVERERNIINENLLKDPLCMNIKLGGEGWCCTGVSIGGDKCKHLNEVYWKIPENNKRRKDIASSTLKKLWKNTEYREKILKAIDWTGKTHKEDSKLKIGSANSINQRGELNSQYNTAWINDGNFDKKIKKDRLEEYLNLGWKRGRTSKK